MRNERGSVSAAYAVLALAMIGAVGIVVDGGRRMGAVAEARDISDNAARAGAQAVDLDQWRQTGTVVLDPAQARLNVIEFMDSQHVVGKATLVGSPVVVGDTVTVTVAVDVEGFTPGLADASVEGSGSADAIESVIGP